MPGGTPLAGTLPTFPVYPRRRRTVFLKDQLIELEKTFRKNKYLSLHERCSLAARLDLKEMQIKTWFQNRR
ncbi:Homeobox protein GBX-1 [Holothuria leucospilota]|uniref:Homeobox protein GBX-1 n=1 Tax=Holothuria leucospilota TaxID=206669 RepID=A0A9Q1HBT1_HOLLE|nr:Homeobox protein GBX-1 [Holothuria leucospilota]